jgi:subtilisin family serine protease
VKSVVCKLVAVSVSLLLVSIGLGQVVGARTGPGGPDSAAIIAPQVQKALDSAGPEDMHTVIVLLKEQARMDAFPDLDRAARLEYLLQTLQADADRAQRDIREWLEGRHAEGQVGQVISFWIFNGLAVTATQDVIWELAERPEVARIEPNEVFQAPDALAVGNPIQPNISLINAPALWDMGFRGQGVVVAIMDTGVDVGHPDLAASWRSGSNSWFDPYGEHPSVPVDLLGHGTQVMGVIVGGDAGGTAIGVAPEAQWIAVKIFDDRGKATTVSIHQGFQWLLDPDGDPETPDTPHVVNSSWTFGSPGCNLAFQADLQALRYASVLPIFAAGNFGPGASTDASPANYPEAFAVGAVDDDDDLYAYGSRGPSACGEPSTVFPEIVAPGVDVWTTDRFGRYVDATGTSVAAPHVAGALALLLNAYPDLTIAEQEAGLVNSALDLGAVGADNEFGHGRLDMLAAYNWITASRLPQRVYLPLVSQGSSDPLP